MASIFQKEREGRIGKLNVKIAVTSEQWESNILQEKCTLGLILSVQVIRLSYLWSRASILKDEILFYWSNAHCGTHM